MDDIPESQMSEIKGLSSKFSANNISAANSRLKLKAAEPWLSGLLLSNRFNTDVNMGANISGFCDNLRRRVSWEEYRVRSRENSITTAKAHLHHKHRYHRICKEKWPQLNELC